MKKFIRLPSFLSIPRGFLLPDGVKQPDLDQGIAVDPSGFPDGVYLFLGLIEESPAKIMLFNYIYYTKLQFTTI
jgi:hypothetical protein